MAKDRTPRQPKTCIKLALVSAASNVPTEGSMIGQPSSFMRIGVGVISTIITS
jgi:hypothetical protein